MPRSDPCNSAEPVKSNHQPKCGSGAWDAVCLWNLEMWRKRNSLSSGVGKPWGSSTREGLRDAASALVATGWKSNWTSMQLLLLLQCLLRKAITWLTHSPDWVSEKRRSPQRDPTSQGESTQEPRLGVALSPDCVFLCCHLIIFFLVIFYFGHDVDHACLMFREDLPPLLPESWD